MIRARNLPSVLHVEKAPGQFPALTLLSHPLAAPILRGELPMGKPILPWFAGLCLLAGCSAMPTQPETEPTRQVASSPFSEPRPAGAVTRVSYTPASQDS